MLNLPNGNKCSQPSITPANWNTTKAKTDKIWIVSYRFYCPEFPKGKLIQLKAGINRFKDLKDRQGYAQGVLIDLISDLKNGFNPITNFHPEPVTTSHLMDSLRYALSKLKVTPDTRVDMSGMLDRFGKSVAAINLDLPINQVSRKHIREILDHLERSSEKFTDNTFNYYRKYLSILFSELTEREIIGADPVKSIKKRAITRKLRQTLNERERLMVDEHLKQYPSFRRFLHIFFHSGARVRELMRLRAKDVDLKRQRFKVTIKKGKESREVWKVIKDAALPYWSEIDLSAGDYFIFSEGLEPGPKEIRHDQIQKRWRRLVQIPLGIGVGFYSLKHLHSDELAKELGLQAAQLVNSHTSETTTKVYAQGEKERQMERIKKSGGGFV